VNSYISNSKNKIAIFFIVFFALVILLDVMLAIFVDRKTTKNRFVDELYSKSKHMSYNAKDRDIIFIGSSRTLYQISTSFFESKGLKIYNYGISGRHIPNYSFMTENALKMNPEYIVIATDLEKLYEPISKYTTFPTAIDIKEYINSSQSINDILSASMTYIKNQHLLNIYDTPIYEKTKYAINKLNSKYSISYDFENKIKETTLQPQQTKNSKDKESIKYDCDYFDIAHNRGAHKHETLLKCKNGDGIIYGNVVTEPTIKTLNKYNKNHLELYNTLVKKAQESGVKVITIFTPKYKNPYIFEDKKELLSKVLSDKIIDMTTDNIPAKMWGDNMHLNNIGRLYYSEHIYKEIKELLEAK
jgi:hypothetical protein